MGRHGTALRVPMAHFGRRWEVGVGGKFKAGLNSRKAIKGISTGTSSDQRKCGGNSRGEQEKKK